MVHAQALQMNWGTLYLFLMAGCLGHLGTWMMWRGLLQHGMVLTMMAAVLLTIVVEELEALGVHEPPKDEAPRGQGQE